MDSCRLFGSWPREAKSTGYFRMACDPRSRERLKVRSSRADRAASNYPLCSIFSRSSLRLSEPQRHVLFLGLFRGALALALAVSIPSSVARREEIVTVSFALVSARGGENYNAALTALVERQIRAFKSGLPAARVVGLHDAHHCVFLSNGPDVLREMNAFLRSLP